MKQSALRACFVEFIPESPDDGVLYISRRFKTAVHLCACGCRSEVVTPLSPAEWRLSEANSTVSLWPSIGNWGLSCQSHYWIRDGQVVWDVAMSRAQIERVRVRDRADKARHLARVNAQKVLPSEKPLPAPTKAAAPTETKTSSLRRTLKRLISW